MTFFHHWQMLPTKSHRLAKAATFFGGEENWSFVPSRVNIFRSSLNNLCPFETTIRADNLCFLLEAALDLAIIKFAHWTESLWSINLFLRSWRLDKDDRLIIFLSGQHQNKANKLLLTTSFARNYGVSSLRTRKMPKSEKAEASREYRPQFFFLFIASFIRWSFPRWEISSSSFRPPLKANQRKIDVKERKVKLIKAPSARRCCEEGAPTHKNN